MRKRFFALFMVTLTLVSSIPDVSFADISSISETIDFTEVTDNSMALQSGGLLSSADYYDDLSTSSNEDKAAELLVNAWENQKESIDISLYNIKVSDLKSFYFGVLNNNPQFFYVKSSYSYSCLGDKVILINIKYSYSVDQIKTMKSEYNKVVNEAVARADSSWSDLEKVMYINNYLTTNTKYDTTYSKYDSYNVFVEKTAVCQGYALAFLELANHLGLSASLVTSDTLNHAWNLVQVNGKYYHIDTTWNDPISDLLGRSRHYYFLKSTSFFNSNDGGHEASDYEINNDISVDDANDTYYDNYMWSNIDTPFYPINGLWYTYNAAKSGICAYTCNGTDMIFNSVVFSLAEKWPAVGNSYYSKLHSLACCNNFLYYTGPQYVGFFDPSDNSAATYYNLTSAQKEKGYIFGISIVPEGTVSIQVQPSPYEDGVIYNIGKLTPSPVEINTTEHIDETTTEETTVIETTTEETTVIETATEETTAKETTTKETTSVKETASAKETTSLKETTSFKETTSVIETTSAKETTSPKETTSLKETTSVKETTSAKETTTKEITPAVETTSAQETTAAETKTDYISLDDCTMSLVTDEYVYDGTEKEPDVIISSKNATLIPDIDYILYYYDNVDAGTASVVAFGLGNYSGYLEQNFIIKKASQNLSASINNDTLDIYSYELINVTGIGKITYTSDNPDVADVSDDGCILALDEGTANITVSASGNKNYKAASTTLHITVTNTEVFDNTITTDRLSYTFTSNPNSTFKKSLNTYAEFGSLTYTSSSKYVKVNSSGVISIQKNYSGIAYISAESESSDNYIGNTIVIKITVKPYNASITKVTAKKNGFSVSWKQNKSASGYVIQYSLKKDFSSYKAKSITSNAAYSATLKNLKKNKKYYIRIKAYRKATVNGKTKTLYSDWSKVKCIKTK